VPAAPTDEIYERYLKKAIAEMNELWDELAHAAHGGPLVLGTGHPLADIFLLKFEPRPSEFQEGIAFFGRAGEAVKKSLGRLNVDVMSVYGTNCVKLAEADEDSTRSWLTRELHIVQPKLVVVMGERALEFLNSLDFPLSSEVEHTLGEVQRFTPSIDALCVPDIDESLDEQPSKTAFWNAFKALGPWWAELPPY
jgi:uracil-DNA glycosylase